MSKTSKRARVLTVVGAGVALLSFLAHDVYREHIARLRDSISSADAAYRFAVFDIRTQEMKSDQAYEFSILKLNIDPGIPSNDHSLHQRLENDFDKRNKSATESLAQASAKFGIELSSYDSLATLIRSLPKDSGDLTSATCLRSRMQQIINDTNQVSSENSHLGRYEFAARDRLTDRLGELIAQAVSLRSDTAKFANETIAKAHQYEDQEDFLYYLATWAYIVLFILGWGLSLTSNLEDEDGGKHSD